MARVETKKLGKCWVKTTVKRNVEIRAETSVGRAMEGGDQPQEARRSDHSEESTTKRPRQRRRQVLEVAKVQAPGAGGQQGFIRVYWLYDEPS